MKRYPLSFAPPLVRGLAVLLFCLLSLCTGTGLAAGEEDKGLFLIATENLHGTSFQETVIFITHLSQGGATGLAINRPTDIPLNHALPEDHGLRNHPGTLFLGGPVNPGALYLLVQTKQPTAFMLPVVDDIYFSSHHADIQPKDFLQLRAYAGFSGWAPGQLQAEIARGDWLTIRTAPGIIFEQDTSGLWQRLYQLKSANWI